MSEAVETTPKTLEQLQAELQEWLDQNGLQLTVMARGLRTGELSSIINFMPATHDAVPAVQQVTR